MSKKKENQKIKAAIKTGHPVETQTTTTGLELLSLIDTIQQGNFESITDEQQLYLLRLLEVAESLPMVDTFVTMQCRLYRLGCE